MRKLLLLSLKGIMSIAILGVGYALWSDTVEIHGSVATGNVDVALVLGAIVEDEDSETLGGEATTADTGLPGDDLDNTDEWMDVGQCDAFLDGNGAMAISLTNVYPSFDCWISFDVISLGTIPVHVDLPQFINAGAGPISPPDGVDVDQCYADQVQLHEGEQESCTIHIHYTNDTIPEQGTTVQFWIQIVAKQYKEP